MSVRWPSPVVMWMASPSLLLLGLRRESSSRSHRPFLRKFQGRLIKPARLRNARSDWGSARIRDFRPKESGAADLRRVFNKNRGYRLPESGTIQSAELSGPPRWIASIKTAHPIHPRIAFQLPIRSARNIPSFNLPHMASSTNPFPGSGVSFPVPTRYINPCQY